MQAEVEAFGNSLQDSGKVLQEKFALARELDRLRPELDHLQSQLSNHQTVVAEKHRLQRQLDSLEVELENEKRARQRTQDKENKNVVAEFKSRAEDAEKRLASERKERDKLNKAHEKALSEATSRNERLQEEISTVKEKLSRLQAELRDAKAEVERHRVELQQQKTAESKPKRAGSTNNPANRKRRFEESILEDPAIQTPGDEYQRERRPSRKRGEHAPVGEKSTFSVTPFLNRSKSAGSASQESTVAELSDVPDPESQSEEEAEGPAEASEPEDHAEAPRPKGSRAKPAISSGEKGPKPRGRPKAKPASEAAPSGTNASNQQGPALVKRGLKQATREVSDASDQENDPAPKPTQTSKVTSKSLLRPSLNLGPPAVGDANGKKKRRKLLGANTTIFDEEDGEVVASVTEGLAGQAAKRKRAPLGGPSNAFAKASFSPLKRDRRGVGASFLA